MKTLTTLTAVAALVVGMSIASAQNSTNQTPQNQSPSSLNKGSQPNAASGSESNGAAMQKKAAVGNQQATGSGKFCVEVSAGGSWDCKYANLAACEKDGKPQNRQCHPNPNTGTTGQKQ